MKCEEIEPYLSAYLDEELTQQLTQKVELHREECAVCQGLVRQLEEAKRAAGALKLSAPSREEWMNMETKIFERAARGIGWSIIIVWLIVTATYALYHLATSPTEPLLEKVLIFSLFLGAALLFLSVLMQRVRESRTDRYKGVLR